MDGPHLHRRESLGFGRRPLRQAALLLAAAWLLSPKAPASPDDAAPAPTASENSQATAGRWHFSYGGSSPFQLSILFRRGSEGDETRLLLAAPSGRLELTATQGPEGDDSEETIIDPNGGERFSRRLHLPSKRRPAACAGVREMDGCLVFTGRVGERTVPLSGFVVGSDGDRLRAEVRALVTERLAAKIASLAPLFARSVEFDRFGDDFLSLVWPKLAWKRPRETEQPERGPGCAFDASFGYPCTERERELEKRRFSTSPGRSRGKRTPHQRELPRTEHCDKISR
ncbi:MAG TPA: hypothetical protein VF580_00515 [Thermoanaerobaculia bacterium]